METTGDVEMVLANFLFRHEVKDMALLSTPEVIGSWAGKLHAKPFYDDNSKKVIERLFTERVDWQKVKSNLALLAVEKS